jgi:hypothetical protein
MTRGRASLRFALGLAAVLIAASSPRYAAAGQHALPEHSSSGEASHGMAADRPGFGNPPTLVAPGGHLVISHSESLNGIRHGMRSIAPAVYRRVL